MCGAPVLQVVQHQRGNHDVERVVVEGKRVLQVGYVQRDVVAKSALGEGEHARTDVDSAHNSSTVAKKSCQGAGTTRGVEDAAG